MLEYHGEHLAVGMDTLAVTRILDHLEREADIVILPPFYYGTASYAVAGAEGNGTLDVPADRLLPFAQSLFASLLKVGFRNIHGFIHHQTENFAAGMPTDLAFKFAARQAIFAFLEAERGEGWWGDAAMADYYAKQADKADPFNWIQVHPLLNAEAIKQFPFDHAGEGETSLMLDLCPEGVDMTALLRQAVVHAHGAEGLGGNGTAWPAPHPRAYAGRYGAGQTAQEGRRAAQEGAGAKEAAQLTTLAVPRHEAPCFISASYRRCISAGSTSSIEWPSIQS